MVHQQGTQNQSFTLPEDILVGFPVKSGEFWFGGKNAIYRLKGHIFHFDGEVWSLVARSQTQLFSSYGTDSNQVWFGGQGILLHFDGTQFEWVPLPTTKQDVRWIWGAQASDMWFADSTTLLHRSGNQFASFAFPLPSISSLSPRSSGKIWIPAQNKIFQREKKGTAWKQVLDLSNSYNGLWEMNAVNPNDIWLFLGSYVLRKQQ